MPQIAIISPASIVKDEYIDSAAEYILSRGYEPRVMPHAKGPACGSYAATIENRLADLVAAFRDPEVSAILCARGGYGVCHLLPLLPEGLIRENPKWLIGFSDISALHAAMWREGRVSIHGPMARHWNDAPGSTASLIFDIMESGRMPEYHFESPLENRPGEAEGILIGGNLAVLNGMAGTPYDMLAAPLHEDCLLFIEDIAEPIYKIERVLYRLLMQGVFSRLKGLIIGQFTEYKPDRNYPSVERMVDDFIARTGLRLPVAYGLPAGHIEGNVPLLLGARVRLSVSPTSARLRQVD